ncbi:class I SAM-dependent methyltransferase [Azonexus sp.]|uniref:class I SAM-dependent methyltransferase n=1 Tax=Azonexus sp. TaxID=1872668 RepID=UPI0035B33F18
MLRAYFKSLYKRTMDEAYGLAAREIAASLAEGGNCLDCGAGDGYWLGRLKETINFPDKQYLGIEWDRRLVDLAQAKGAPVLKGDLNRSLPFEDERFSCVFALSVLEHLLNPCHFMQEAFRVLKPGGRLVILTPNISTYFTALLILLGKMPSSGPHPDSNSLMKTEEVFKVSSDELQWDTETDTPVHRHLVVFSYRVLNRYLDSIGFSKLKGHGFGLYPFPNFVQPVFERIDPYHCHQMVFVAEK